MKNNSKSNGVFLSFQVIISSLNSMVKVLFAVINVSHPLI